MTRGKRHNLMVDKFVVRSGHKRTGYTFVHNITRKKTARFVFARPRIGVSFVELMAPQCAQLGNIEFEKAFAKFEVREKLNRMLSNLVAILKPNLVKHLNVLNKLLDPGVNILFVPNRRPEPGSEQRAALLRPAGESLKPFESAKLQFEVGGEEAAIFENFGVGPSGMFVSAFVVGVSFALKQSASAPDKKTRETIIFSIGKSESFEGGNKRVIHKSDKEHPTHTEVEVFVIPNASEHIPPAPRRSETSCELRPSSSRIREPDS